MALTLFWTGYFTLKWLYDKRFLRKNGQKSIDFDIDEVKGNVKDLSLKLLLNNVKEKLQQIKELKLEILKEFDNLKIFLFNQQNELDRQKLAFQERLYRFKSQFLLDQLSRKEVELEKSASQVKFLESEITRLKEALETSEDEKKTLKSVLNVAIQQKVALNGRLEKELEKEIVQRKRTMKGSPYQSSKDVSKYSSNEDFS